MIFLIVLLGRADQLCCVFFAVFFLVLVVWPFLRRRWPYHGALLMCEARKGFPALVQCRAVRVLLFFSSPFSLGI